MKFRARVRSESFFKMFFKVFLNVWLSVPAKNIWFEHIKFEHSTCHCSARILAQQRNTMISKLYCICLLVSSKIMKVSHKFLADLEVSWSSRVYGSEIFTKTFVTSFILKQNVRWITLPTYSLWKTQIHNVYVSVKNYWFP